MDDLDHPALIKKWKHNLDTSAFENNLYKYIKLPSIKGKNECNDKTEFCPKIIKKSINWSPL